MTAAKSILILADVFPPAVAVGVHRVVGLCRHLTEEGWEVTVITAQPKASSSIDRSPLKRMAKEMHVVRTAAPDLLGMVLRIVKRRSCSADAGSGNTENVDDQSAERNPEAFRRLADWLSWWLHVPDRSIGWLIPAARAALREARRRRPGVIFSTAPVWTSHLIGLVLSKLLRVPWVADFRDPWRGSAWHHVPYRWQDKVDARLERMVVRNATAITCAWDGIRRHLASYYPDQADHMRTVLNGFEEAEIESIEPIRLDDERCVLLHAGTLYGPRSPVPLFRRLRHLKDQRPERAQRLLLVLLGPPTYNGQPLRALAYRHGVEDLVRVMPSTSHATALSYLKGADVAVLFGQCGGTDLAPVPAKTYEYVGMGKPVLAIGAGHEALSIMQRGGCRVWNISDDDSEACAEALERIALDNEGRQTTKTPENAAFAFTRKAMAEAFERLFLELR